MSLDSSLKSASSLVRHRNVLTRGERLTRLAEQEKWNEGKSALGLPKVANRKAAIAKAEKTETADAAAPTPGGKAAAPAAGAKAAAPAAGGKAPAGGKAAAAPAAGAKAAAPAAKGKK
jgi:small basic protein (TIGR04137 family)